MKLFAHLACSLVALTAISTIASAGVTLTLSRKVGPPTSTVTAAISGFAAGRTVDVFFDSKPYCVAITNRLGSGSCTFSIPASAQPQTHWFSAIQRNAATAVRMPFLVRTDWAQFRGNSRRTGFNVYENTIGPATAGGLTQIWAVRGNGISSPVVANGNIYLRSFSHSIEGFNAQTGMLVPGFPVGLDDGHASPAVYRNIIYLALKTGNTAYLKAYNASNGTKVSKLSKQIAGYPVDAPVVESGNVYQAELFGRIFAFNASTGVKLANFPVRVPGHLHLAPVFANGVMYAVSSVGHIYAYNATTGALMPSQPSQVQYAFTPKGLTISGTRLVVAGNYVDNTGMTWGEISLVDLNNANTPVVQIKNLNPIYGTPAVTNDRLLVINSNGQYYTDVYESRVRAYSTDANPELVWEKVIPELTYVSPIIANGVAYLNSYSRFYALDMQNGQVLWSRANIMNDDAIGRSPVVVNGMLYMTTTDSSSRMIRAFSIPKNLALPSALSRPEPNTLKPDLSLKPQ